MCLTSYLEDSMPLTWRQPSAGTAIFGGAGGRMYAESAFRTGAEWTLTSLILPVKGTFLM